MNLKQKYQSIRAGLTNKLNPAQSLIRDNQGESHTSEMGRYDIVNAYQDLEVVGRGVDLIVDSCIAIDIDIKNKISGLGNLDKPIKKTRLNLLLNHQANPFQTIDQFRSALFMDYILEGCVFLYFDGRYLYHLPAKNVEIIASKTKFIKEFKYDEKKFTSDEIIYIRDNSAASIFRGTSRLMAAQNSITILKQMIQYQYDLFKNGMVTDIILSTPNVLSEKMKERTLAKWRHDYKVGRGAHSPAILDGDYKVETLGNSSFKELDFINSMKVYEEDILKALGVNPVLLSSGNNSNISPNVRLFYIMTILPICEKVVKGVESFFGYDCKIATENVLGLRPELNELASYLTQLTNAGIISQNESREQLRMAPSSDEGADKLIKPVNVAGDSAAGSAEPGGRPPDPEE